MNLKVPGIIYLTFLCLLISQNTFSSDGGASMSDKDINNVSKTDVVEKDDKERLSKAASLLTNYEIEAKKLLEMLKTKNINSKTIQNKAKDLLSLSEVVIESAQFRLPQCNEYLTKTLAIKTKDLFIHPATVYVLVRDDPSLQDATKSSINAEITEVLAHTELVRRLVIY